MSDIRERYARLLRSGEGTERLQFFSDAVFAIALTLLVLDIRPPDDAGDHLVDALAALWPQYFGFALSFVIIALNWISHHAKFRVIVRFDARLIQLNFVVLFLVVFVPFPTSVLSEYAQTSSVVFYAVSLAALSLSQLITWTYAYRAKLTTPDVDAAMYLYVVLNILPAPTVFVLSIPIAFIDPSWALYSWFAIIPASFIYSAISRRLARSGDVSRRSRDSASAAEH